MIEMYLCLDCCSQKSNQPRYFEHDLIVFDDIIEEFGDKEHMYKYNRPKFFNKGCPKCWSLNITLVHRDDFYN